MKISVIVLVHTRGGYLIECLQSVVDQSYPAHEIVLVDTLDDDGYIRDIVSQIDHPRVKCVFPVENKACLFALEDGRRASSGEVICFLDESDKFKHEKLGEVARYFNDNPQENAVVHACFEVSRNGTILSLWRPKTRIKLENFLLLEPIPLSALAIRQLSVDGLSLYIEDNAVEEDRVSFIVRLLLSNISLNVIDRPLCKHRVVSDLGQKSLRDSLQQSVQMLEAIFSHPDCSGSLLYLRESALARIYLKFSYEAFVRGDGALGRELLRSSIYLDRSILDVQAARFFLFLIVKSVNEDDHQNRITQVFEQLPAEMMWMMPRMNEVIARGFVLRGMRAVLWGRFDEGKLDLAEAVKLGCRIDQYFYFALGEEMLSCESVYGPANVDSALHVITPYLEKMSAPPIVRWFKGEFFANRAFREFNSGRYSIAIRSIRYAILAQPIFMTNRGLLATLFRSLGRLRLRSS